MGKCGIQRVEKMWKGCYNVVMDVEKLKRLIGVEYREKFSEYAALLKEYNKMYNLTAICDDEGIFYRHFLDSVAGESLFKEGADCVEIGSGGGFPSLPLKIIRDDLKFTLIESTGKKCAFLRAVVDKLGLTGVNILNIRAEDGAKDLSLREKFDVCCARAVGRLNTLSEYCLPYVKVGGTFVAYKGDCGEEIKEAERAVKLLGGRIKEVLAYDLENCGKRTLVTVEKVCATPLKYPRGQGKERKSPL